MDVVLWILAVGTTTISFCIGIAVGKSQRVKPPKPEPPQRPNLQCGCNHGLSYHDPQTNRCVKEDQVTESYNPRTGERVYKQVPCTCRQYTGDKPIDTYFSPRISLPQGES